MLAEFHDVGDRGGAGQPAPVAPNVGIGVQQDDPQRRRGRHRMPPTWRTGRGHQRVTRLRRASSPVSTMLPSRPPGKTPSGGDRDEGEYLPRAAGPTRRGGNPSGQLAAPGLSIYWAVTVLDVSVSAEPALT